METDDRATAPAGASRAWYVLALLFGVYVMNMADRPLLGSLAEDLKRDLGLSDGEYEKLFFNWWMHQFRKDIFSSNLANFELIMCRFASDNAQHATNRNSSLTKARVPVFL